MKNNLYAFSLVVLTFLLSCAEKKVSHIIDGFSLPEGAVSDGQFIYISNVGKNFKPLDKDGDGFISKLTPDGKIVALHFLPSSDTLNSPKGMAVINHILYVTDIDRIVGYNLSNKKKVYDLSFAQEGTQLLNDLAVRDDHTLFVSAMDIDKIFVVTVDTPAYTLMKLDQPIKKPNGLFWDASTRKLYLGMFGREGNANGKKGDIGVISFDKGYPQYNQLSDYQGNIDGVLVMDNTLFFTDWLAYGPSKGTLRSMDLTTKEVKDVIDEKIDGSGDFYFDEKTGNVWIPMMKENKVLIHALQK